MTELHRIRKVTGYNGAEPCELEITAGGVCPVLDGRLKRTTCSAIVKQANSLFKDIILI